MSNFSSAFQQALSDLSVLRQDFAKQIGVTPSQVSAYAGATIPVGDKAISRVCNALPGPHKGRVLRGYLLDQIPAGAESSVTIEVQTADAQNPRLLPEMDDELASAFNYLAGRALKENIFRSLVIDLHHATSGEFMDIEPARLKEEANRPRIDLPLFGHVPAGWPSDNPQTKGRKVRIPDGKTYPKDAFALEVRGDSMIGRGIHDGDIVVVHKAAAKNGDVVVALIDGETTLKTLVSRKGKWKLRAENPNYIDPILTEQSAIQAVMIDKLN